MLKTLFGDQAQAFETFWKTVIKPLVRIKFEGYLLKNCLEDRTAALWMEVLRQCGVRYQPLKGKALPQTSYAWKLGS